MKKGSFIWFIVFLIGTFVIWFTQATVASDTAMLMAAMIQMAWLFACFHGPSTLRALGSYFSSILKHESSDDNEQPKL